MRVRTALLSAALLATACSNGASPHPLPTSGTTSASATAAPPSAVVETGDPTFTHWGSPSRNLGCEMSATSVACEIGQHEWALPPRPTGCQFDWIATISADASGTTVGACQSDTLLVPTRVLAYGHAIRVGDWRCDSTTAGVRCANERTGRGFSISRSSYEVF